MNLLTVLLIVLIVLALSGGWGYRAGCWLNGGRAMRQDTTQ